MLLVTLLPVTARADNTTTKQLFYTGTDSKLHIGSIASASYFDGEGTARTGNGNTLTLTNFHFTTSASTALYLQPDVVLELIGTNTATSTYHDGANSCIGTHCGVALLSPTTER